MRRPMSGFQWVEMLSRLAACFVGLLALVAASLSLGSRPLEAARA